MGFREQKYSNYKSQSKSMDTLLWEPQGTLVNTLYNFKNYTNKILDLDVAQDSKYFTSISESKSQVMV